MGATVPMRQQAGFLHRVAFILRVQNERTM